MQVFICGIIPARISQDESLFPRVSARCSNGFPGGPDAARWLISDRQQQKKTAPGGTVGREKNCSVMLPSCLPPSWPNSLIFRPSTLIFPLNTLIFPSSIQISFPLCSYRQTPRNPQTSVQQPSYSVLFSFYYSLRFEVNIDPV